LHRAAAVLNTSLGEMPPLIFTTELLPQPEGKVPETRAMPCVVVAPTGSR